MVTTEPVPTSRAPASMSLPLTTRSARSGAALPAWRALARPRRWRRARAGAPTSCRQRRLPNRSPADTGKASSGPLEACFSLSDSRVFSASRHGDGISDQPCTKTRVFRGFPVARWRRRWGDATAARNVHVERPPSREAARVPASPPGGRSARTCAWASLFSTSDPRQHHARTFSTSVAICTNSTVGRTP